MSVYLAQNWVVQGMTQTTMDFFFIAQSRAPSHIPQPTMDHWDPPAALGSFSSKAATSEHPIRLMIDG